eukprot:6776356-Alexandrium_andersonii.AAC.1
MACLRHGTGLCVAWPGSDRGMEPALGRGEGAHEQHWRALRRHRSDALAPRRGSGRGGRAGAP